MSRGVRRRGDSTFGRDDDDAVECRARTTPVPRSDMEFEPSGASPSFADRRPDRGTGSRRADQDRDRRSSGETRPRRLSPDRRQPDVGALAQAFSAELGVADRQSIDRIALIIDILGARLAADLLAEVHTIEANGGMWSHDRKRRKTPLGVFFFQAWQQMTDAERREVWPELTALVVPPMPEPAMLLPPPPARPQPKEAPRPPEPARPSQPLARVQPEAQLTRIILFGRPSAVAERGTYMRVVIEGGPAPPLPPDLPRPPKRSTTYVVYIPTEQWLHVRDAVERQGQMLIIRGWHVYDSMLDAITVWALAVTAGLPHE